MDREKWKELGFDPPKDGYWATADLGFIAQETRRRIQRREAEDRKIRIAAFCVCAVATSVFSIVIYILL